MEGTSLALSAAQTLLTALQCPDLKEMSSLFEYKSHLDELHNTVSTVKAVLLDAERKQELSNETQNYIQKLKDAVYDADDLLDEFVTIAQQKQIIQDGKAFEKVHFFFSRLNPLVVASKMSKRVKKIKIKLEGIANDHNKYGFGVDYQPIRNRREETCSYAYEGSIIGRENDVENIVAILLDNSVQYQQDVSFFSIVGIGGMGKTALAQLLFNDVRIGDVFPKRLWTCVSDHEQEKLDVEGILRKILASATGVKHEHLPMEEVQRQLRGKLASNKYLLVLDDVWTENRIHWLNLVEYLLGGRRGSWIVVTTRSEETARIIGSNSVHKLQGLSKEDSWSLFKKVALEQTKPDGDLVTIGEKIVQRCVGVPLAIRVVGSLLYAQDKSKWLLVKEIGFSNIRENQNDIFPILMISYHNLESPLKSCFSYCTLFPKDYMIKKDVLLSLWMAQGYVVPLDVGQSIEDAAEEYFSILLRRCFFQDVQKSSNEEIISCKIHDLMHDLAHKVAAKEIFVSDSLSGHIGENVRHLAHIGSKTPKYTISSKTRLRSYVQLEAKNYAKIKVKQHNLEALVEKITSVRALYLLGCEVQILPKAIENLIHLRYLNLSRTELVELPESFRKFYNLETFILDSCSKLEELPKDINKLVKLRVLSARFCISLTEVPSDLGKLANLRVLDMHRCYKLSSMPSNLGNLSELRVLSLSGCDSLTKMPRGLNKLTNLKGLPGFTLREASPSCTEWFDHLEELQALSNLKDRVWFVIQTPKNSKIECRGGGYLRNKKSITCVWFEFIKKNIDETAGGTEEALMEALEPHCDLKELEVRYYHGVRMPSWASSLSNLVKMRLLDCEELQELTCLGNLNNLKELNLQGLPKLEYIIEKHTGTSGDNIPFFPSLVELRFDSMPMLKGWGIRISDDDLQLLCLSQLESLRIYRCPEMTLFPQCPRVKFLHLHRTNDKLDIKIRMERQSDDEKALRDVEVRTDNMTWLKSHTKEFFQQVTYVVISDDNGVGSWEAIENGMPWPSLRCLILREIENMETLPNWIRCLSASLENLQIRYCQKFETLPAWLTELTSLDYLRIWNCKNFETIQTWMSELTSLRVLDIDDCSKKLRERCQKPGGECWPYIQHIPRIIIDFSFIQG